MLGSDLRRGESAPPAAARLPGRLGSATVLSVAAFGAFLAFLDATIVNVAFPSIERSFPGSSLSQLSWVLNAYNVVFAAFLVVFGRLADLIGRRRTFVAGVLLFTVASAICGAAGSVSMLIVGRVVQALGAALLVPASLALVVQAVPPQRRAHAVSLWGAAAAAAAGLGPPLGGALVQAGGWRWAFFVNLPIGVGAAVLARKLLVESRAQGRRRLPDLRGAVLLAVAVGLLTLAIVQGQDWGWTSAALLVALALAVVAFAGFVASSARHPVPLLDRDLLRIRTFAVSNVATLLAGMGFYAYLLNNILWLQHVWGYDVLEAGGALVPSAVVAVGTAAVVGPLADRRGHRVVVIVGALVWALAYVWYRQRAGTHADFLGAWLPGQVLSGIGAGAVLPVLAGGALGAVPGGRFATASAVVTATRQLGGVLGVAVLVVLIGSPTGGSLPDALRNGWLLSCGCFVGTALVATALGRVSQAAERGPDEQRGAVRVAHLPESPQLDRPRSLSRVPADATPRTLLSELPAEARRRLEQAAVRRQIRAGEWLVEEGTDADCAYVLLSGRMDVYRDGVPVSDLRAGSVIGELALLTGETRVASVRARRDSTVLELSRAAFDEVIFADREALGVLVRSVADRMVRPQRRSAKARALPSTVAIVAASDGAPVQAVAAAIRRALPGWCRVAVPERVDVAELERAERDHDRVLLVADGSDPGWQQFCARQADFLIVVARADAPVHDGVRAHEHQPDLVLIGAEPSRETLQAWSAETGAGRITSARPDDLGTALRPVAARIAGESLGVVLAGGGARSLVQIGVLHELLDAGLRIDRVAGCSMGALIGGVLACGADGPAVERVVYAEVVRRNPVGDYTLPRTSLLRGRRLDDAIDRSFADALPIEALPRSFQSVSTDLRSRSRVVHDRGDIRLAVRASSRIPGVFPPVRTQDQLLVDGGILDNMPVDLLTDTNEGPVIAVNVALGNGGADRHAASPAQPRVPALGETLLRTMLINSSGASDEARRAGAYVVSPQAENVGLLEFHQFDVLVNAGRAAARDLLELTGGHFERSVVE